MCRWSRAAAAALVAVVAIATSVATNQTMTRKLNVAHRGASAYAPEHTLAAYRLAIEQGADFVEQDLGVTHDGVLVCLHDETLERTTDVEDVFPDRARTVEGRRTWPVADFTLNEVKRLDAGRWFDPRFAGERVPTWQEAIDLVRGRAGLYPELKAPAQYRERGVDMVALLARSLERNGLHQAGADRTTPVVIQSFDAEALEAVARALPTLPRTLLFDLTSAAQWGSDEGLRRAAAFATGIGPARRVVERDGGLIERAHAAGLTVTVYTFGARAPERYSDVRAAIAQMLGERGADGVFTDNPDLFPR